MATRQDDGGSRLWRGMRHLIFGDESEPTLREEIEEAIDEAEEARPIAGDLSPAERQMLRNLLHFGEQTAGDICVTRGDIISVPSSISFDDLVRAFADAGHSRLPVYGESLDDVIGMIHIKDVFVASIEPGRDRSLAALMREPLFVPESMGVIELLARMRQQRIHLAIVVDEFGGTEGLVTIEDVVEEIVGDIEDEHDEAEAGMLTMVDEGVWDADARLELDELAQAVDPRLSSEEDEVDTVGGLVFLLAGHIPTKGECVTHPSGWTIEALDSDPRRIIRVRLHAPERETTGSSFFANSLAGSAMALNSSALPAGSSRNMVACSPGCPAKRTVGGITNSTSASVSRSASCSHSAFGSTRPKCGTGTSSPSTAFVVRRGARSGARCATIWCP
jgi:CBS domain containing-hemolysin-like protein